MYILADIGGTNMRLAGSRDLTVFGTPVVLPTPQKYEDGISAFVEAARTLASGEKLEGAVIGIKGVISDDKTTLMTAPQNILRDWKGKPIANDIRERLSLERVLLENDTALVGLGEAIFGAGKGASIVMYLTVSTGVNGVRIVDGTIDRGRAEIGGAYMQIGDAIKTLEELVSGASISEKFGVHPKEIDKDSPLWEELSVTVAYAVHNAILHWSPDRVVLGGSMFNEIGIPVPRVKAHVEEMMQKLPRTPDIAHAQLETLGGLWGGVALLKNVSLASKGATEAAKA